MKTTPDSRLQRLLGEPALAALRQRLRRRFELADAEETISSIHLNNLDPMEYSALCQLTGRPSRIARSMTLDIADLNGRLRAAGLANSLQNALEQLDGPIVAKASLRKMLSAQWSALTSSASAAGGPLLRAWLQDTATSMSLLKRLGRDFEVLGQERCRRWNVEENLAMVRESLEPGHSVSVVARRNGINPNQPFHWRKLYQDGSLSRRSVPVKRWCRLPS